MMVIKIFLIVQTVWADGMIKLICQIKFYRVGILIRESANC